MKRLFSILLFFSLVGGGCAGTLPSSSGAPANASSAPQALERGYRLRPGDQLEIILFGRGDVSRKVPIREDGTFLLPPVGVVEAAGHSIQEVEQQIQKRLDVTKASEETAEGEEKKLPAPQQILTPEEASKQIYRLQPGDQMEISVWSHDDLQRTSQVREDGSFSFPLIGNVQAAGRSLQEVEQEVQERLEKDYLVSPQVSVKLAEAKFSVLGEVANPGWYATQGSTDLLTAISQAGGSTKTAVSQVEILRPQGKGRILIRADLQQIFLGRQPTLNVFPRDTLHVAGQMMEGEQVSVRLFGAKFSILGEVDRPGSYLMEGSVDLLSAISQAGGISKFGSSRVDVIRDLGNKKLTLRSDVQRIIRGKAPNVDIFPHDTIFIRRKLF